MFRNIYLIVILSSAFFSGYFIDTEISSKGIIVLSQIFLSIFCLIYLIYTFGFNLNHGFNKKWLYLSIIFIIILFLNGSNFGSILLVGANLVLYEIVRRLNLGDLLIQYLDFNYLYLLIYVILIFALLKLSSSDETIWSYDYKVFDFPRLFLWNSEPSHLGMLIAPMIFLARPLKNRISLFTILLLTQSFFGYLFLIYIYLVYKKIGKYIIAFCFLSMLFYFQSIKFEDYFTDSGLVRFIGFNLFELNNYNLLSLLFGHGLGAGDQALAYDFQSMGVEVANGFLFSTIYDVGLIGIIIIIKIYTTKIDDIFILFILLLNFGLGNILFVLILVMSKLVFNKFDKKTYRFSFTNNNQS